MCSTATNTIAPPLLMRISSCSENNIPHANNWSDKIVTLYQGGPSQQSFDTFPDGLFKRDSFPLITSEYNMYVCE